MKIAIAVFVGFLLGFAAHLALFHQPTRKDHWRTIERYNAYVHDAANYKRDAATGLSVASPPAVPEPSLAALVAAGELTHVDLALRSHS